MSNTKAIIKAGYDLVLGRQAVLEALCFGKPARVALQEGQKGSVIEQIVAQARRKSVPLVVLSREEFSRLVRDHPGHQGAAALVPPFSYLSLDELLEAVQKKTAFPFLILLDHLQDPRNFGSILRTADAAGVDGFIIPEHRSVKVTPAVYKVAAGAVPRARIALVKNLVRALERLKKEQFWIYGAEADGAIPFYRADYRVPLGLVVGSEGRGLSPLVRRHCDAIVHIPMPGPAGSLNVAVAAALLIYEVLAQREGWRR